MTNRRSVVCLPFAGAGASVFYRWQREIDSDLELVPVQLPGREDRIVDEPLRTVHEVIDAVSDTIVEHTRRQGAPAIFGHSLGAVLAYELASELEARGSEVAIVIVSGSREPASARLAEVSGLPDDEFIARVRELIDYDHPAMHDPDLRELILPALRADVAMHEAYEWSPRPPISAPIASLRGRDDVVICEEQARAWSALTSGQFFYRELNGGHMYLADQPRRLLDEIVGLLGELHSR